VAGKSGQGRRSRAGGRSEAAVIPLPGARARRPRARQPGAIDRVARYAPSGKSLLIACALLALGVGGYFVARDTSLFAIRKIEVVGAPPDVAAAVRATAQPLLGSSLVALDGHALQARLGALPTVAAVRYDRAFPHTLKIVIAPERAVAVLRQGAGSWLVSARGRVMSEVPQGSFGILPRIWIPASADVAVGVTLVDQDGGRAARSLAPLARTPIGARVRFVRSSDKELTWVLESGREVRLGDAGSLGLKLAVVAKILPTLGDREYVDVSVPERPVAGSIAPPTPPPATVSATPPAPVAAAPVQPVSPAVTPAPTAPAGAPSSASQPSTTTGG
jgi:cell division protein FtsQ